MVVQYLRSNDIQVTLHCLLLHRQAWLCEPYYCITHQASKEVHLSFRNVTSRWNGKEEQWNESGSNEASNFLEEAYYGELISPGVLPDLDRNICQ